MTNTKMKIALLGKGKTGSKVIELCEGNPNIELTIFDRSHSPTRENLAGHDVILSFFTGDTFLEYIEEISESGICVVSGSTGFDWTPERLSLVEKSGRPWIHSNNFALGMNLVKQMIEVLSNAQALFNEFDCTIHEVHHTKKLDAPSGTAKAWHDWLNQNCEITSERTGDVIGDHQLTFKTNNERIFLRHEALDRKIFAEGALWACNQIKNLKPGLHDFSEVARKALLGE